MTAETVRHIATLAVAWVGGITLGLVIAAAILDLTTIQDVWRAQARTEALRERRNRRRYAR